ncbi:hypothetical protein ACM46_11870 [Chryseobacterium angstadtii]|uniref:DUF4876 domain-containing protein n=1 Tax=Chryseobacterium angstadtii TaxID=558151 RepID=A0A0J7L770_9FLAO|nr:DUF4876 domain-containing protein [Chryseobacterium angstadtii]KMQ64900.1 hypothetical protein ACM46_11870 [Chryseobacterium angstadtii]
MDKKVLFLMMAFLLFLTGCRDDDFVGGNNLTPVAFNIQVKYDPSVGNIAAANTNVTLKNLETGETVTGKTDANGELKLAQVLPGTYDVTANIALTSSEYYQIFGISTNQSEVNFNGSQQKISVNINVSSATIVLSNGRVGDFVVKQYYYAGSSNSVGALFRDQFVEIHNNSNQVLYADGLYVAILEGNTNNTVAAYTQANGQYDWSKSTGNSIGSAANTDYVYASSVFKIPGSGTDYPIQPGKSFVIAQTAINHKAPYTNNNGQNVSIQDPSLTVDLSGAEFETYLGDYLVANGGSVFGSDVQNPAVPDMKVVFWSNGNDWILNLVSRPAIVIFNGVSDAEINNYIKIPNPKDLAGKLFMRIPKNVIMDGVDTTNKTLTAPKDLPDNIDAGLAYIKNPAGEAFGDYTSQAVIRKTKNTVSGRVILQDTNNSSNDFVTIKANPKGYAQ